MTRVLFQRAGDQTVTERTEGDAAGREELGVHADAGEAGNGVDLVENHGIVRDAQEEVHARKAAPVERGEDAAGGIADFIGFIALRFSAGMTVREAALLYLAS